jgi:hypothetical protein
MFVEGECPEKGGCLLVTCRDDLLADRGADLPIVLDVPRAALVRRTRFCVLLAWRDHSEGVDFRFHRNFDKVYLRTAEDAFTFKMMWL